MSAAMIFRVLADPTRLAVLENVMRWEMTVTDLTARFAVTQPAISQHLKILRDARLVIGHTQGTRNVYQLNPAGFGSLRDYFDTFWSQALNAFKSKVEEQ